MIEVILILSLISAILSVESKKTLHSLIFLILFGLCLGGLFYMMGATWVALFQISVFSAGIGVLGYVILNLTGGDTE